MPLIDHIRRCNQWNPGNFMPLRIAGAIVGQVRPAFAAHLAEHPDVFAVASSGVDLIPDTPDARTAALRRVIASLIADGVLPALHGEDYPVIQRWGDAPLCVVDRRIVPAFGVRAFGIHVNGYRRDGDRLRLWIGRRAADKRVEPGKLDNMVAGGLPVGLTPAQNVIKEAAEEADVPRTLAATARAVGAITYCLEDATGLKPDTLFLYDLELPSDFVPRNTDGEIAEFMLIDVAAIEQTLRAGNAFKFNVALVLIDFLVRHGRLSPENQPDYLDLVEGLRQPLPIA